MLGPGIREPQDPVLASLASRSDESASWTEEDGLALMASDDLHGLTRWANEERERRHQRTVTLLQVVERAWNDVDTASDPPIEGAFELRLSARESSLEEFTGVCREVNTRWPDATITMAEVEELETWSSQGSSQKTAPPKKAIALDDIVSALRDAHVSALVVDTYACDSESLDRLERLPASLAAKVRLTYDKRTTKDAWVATLNAVSRTQARTGSIVNLIVMPRIDDHPTSGLDDMRAMATARLLAKNIDHLSAAPTDTVLPLAPAFLHHGVDDIENVHAEEAEFRATLIRWIRESGFEPQTRGAHFCIEPPR